jgi:surface protein
MAVSHIGRWNVGEVVNMSSMFDDANAFNQDIGDWNVGKVTNMYFPNGLNQHQSYYRQYQFDLLSC